MNQTSGDSEAYIVCMSTKKDNEKGLLVIANGEKDTNFVDLERPVEDAVMSGDNTMKTKRGTIKFPPKTFTTLANARKDRKTAKATKRNKDNDFVK